MAITILQISDLHRDPAQEITNTALINSLERDRERYVASHAAIGPTDLIIVSGDLIYGVSPTSANAEAELSRQYALTEDFICKLADSFVSGNRERVVIIPGNHDVSYYHCMLSMRELTVPPSDPGTKEILAGFVKRLWSPNSPVRWSWANMAFYEVAKPDIYASRLSAFAEFYRRFYKSSRSYSLKSDEQFDIFDYPSLNLTIAAFSSCYNNDPLNRQGAIHPDAIAGAIKTLHTPKYRNRLLIAVWHHNTSGAPMQSDYMDSETLQILIEGGFSIGFHGHQHKPQFIDEKFIFGGSRKLTVISAGTLCAGPHQLPSGHSRGYNVVTIDDEMKIGRLHLRRMQNENFGQPIWGEGQFTASLTSVVEFTIQSPPDMPGGTSDLVAMLSEAETLIRSKAFLKAAEIVRPLSAQEPLARRLLLECYVSLDDTRGISHDFYPPTSASEIVYVADALWAEKQLNRLRELLGSEIVLHSNDRAVVEVRGIYLERLSK